MQRPPFDVETAQFDARPGRLFQLLDDPAPRPQVRKSAPDDVGKRDSKGHRQRGAQGHPVFPVKSSLLAAHLRINQLLCIKTSRRAMLLRSSAWILFPPAILWRGL